MSTKDLTEQGHIIMEARKREGLTQEQLAAKLHVGKMAVSNWELGKNDVDIEIAGQLENILKIRLANDAKNEHSHFITPLYEIQTIEELDENIERLLDEVPMDHAFASTIRTILRVAIYAIFANTMLDRMEEAETKVKETEGKSITIIEALKYAGNLTMQEIRNRLAIWHDIASDIPILIDKEDAVFYHSGLPEYEKLMRKNDSYREKEGIGNLADSLGAIKRRTDQFYTEKLGSLPVKKDVSDELAYKIIERTRWKIWSLQRFRIIPEEGSLLGMCIRTALLNLERTAFYMDRNKEEFNSLTFVYPIV